MKNYFKLLSLTLALIITLMGVSVFTTSAEDTYTQPEKFIYGDTNLDGKVTVADATLIQKGLAKIEYVTAVQRFVSDPECNGFNVKNATAIQKYLAKYETSTPWETEIPMTSENEFSKHVSIEDDFVDYRIIIGVKQTDGFNYTLENFPEYSFKSIESYAEFNNIKISAYFLYLESPSKENVIKAIKALDYRANIDLLWAEPNYIAYAVDDIVALD